MTTTARVVTATTPKKLANDSAYELHKLPNGFAPQANGKGTLANGKLPTQPEQPEQNGPVANGLQVGKTQGAKKEQPLAEMPYEPVSEIDKKDEGTPDQWVPRHPELIRLTGRHPLNVEPPPTKLMDRGFITPASLHYVRNHGPVPRLSWENHKVTVTGLVSNPRTFSMDEIEAMPSVTFPCSLACAGNRRKEQNMVKKTIGFSWGPAGTACSYWTGVRMSTLLKLCGVDTEADDLHVRFRGIKGELPKGKDGSYGTSLPLQKCMYDGNDIIVAYKQNGRHLEPDHGFPVRMIIPGHIGGRMVKWLEEIEVAETESDNHYHYNDNRVLPSHVDEALAKDEGWWYKPDFIINELNVNSAITSPAHEAVVPYSEKVTVKGYAYAGGGMKVIRCELSINDGKSWRLANIKRIEEKPNREGKWWCWVHWEIEVNTVELLETREMCCRAWTADMNTQPMNFTWNLMGMMNNCVYRVKIHPSAHAAGLALRYEHPVIAGAALGGWMNRANEQPAAVEAVVATVPNGKAGRKISMAEVEKHADKTSAWFVRDSKVYDGTAFLKDHPGGAESILLASGMDSTDDFNAIHSAKAKAMVEDYYIGDLDDSAPEPSTSAESAATTANGLEDSAHNGRAFAKAETSGKDAAGALISLNPRKKERYRLIEKEVLSHNVRRFRFALQSSQHRFGLPVGKHVYVYGKWDGETVMRAYTPTSSDDDLGYFDLVVKVYWANQHPDFPAGGRLSQWLEQQPIGAQVEVKGPTGHFNYKGRGKYTMGEREGFATHISLCAGGTGITPCYQVIKAVLKDPEDKTQLSLLYANQTPEDILLWDELEALAAKHDNFRVWYTVSGFPTGGNPKHLESAWKYDVGRMSQDMAEKHLFPPSSTTLACFCGPPPMITYACVPFLKKMGYKEEEFVIF